MYSELTNTIEQLQHQNIDEERKITLQLLEVEDVANAAEFFASDLSSFVNGQHLLVNGGATQ